MQDTRNTTIIFRLTLQIIVMLCSVISVRSIVSAGDEPVVWGTCCLPDGSCTLMLDTTCAAAGGVHTPHVTCPFVNCPPAVLPGACCFEGYCQMQDELGGEACIAAGGHYLGDSTNCFDCPAPGACCFDDGSCRHETELGGDACTDDGGVYQGDSSLCPQVMCVENTNGGCCVDEGCVDDLSARDCLSVGGFWLGKRVECSEATCDPVVIHVDATAPAGGDGASWATALRHPAEAVLAVDDLPSGVRGEVRIAGGTYALADRLILRDRTTLRGHYGGLSSLFPDERDSFDTRTILTGDLAGDDDEEGSLVDDNAPTLIRVLEHATIDGVVVRGSAFTALTLREEAALRLMGAWFEFNGFRYGSTMAPACIEAEPHCLLIADGCRLQKNGAGSIRAVDAWLYLTDGLFSRNDGSAVVMESTSLLSSQLVIRDVQFDRNKSEAGSALHLADTRIDIDDVYFGGNLTHQRAAVWLHQCDGRMVRVRMNGSSPLRHDSRGGAMYLSECAITFANCQIDHSRARDGGSGVYASNCELTFANCRFWNNRSVPTSAHSGAAMAVSGGPGVTIANCDFVGNSGRSRAASLFADHVVVANTVFRNNHSTLYHDERRHLGPLSGTDSIERIANCYIENWTGLYTADGVITAAPVWDDNVLQQPSPWLDAGNNALVPADTADIDNDGDTTEPLPIDYAGNPRRTDAVRTPDTGSGSGDIVDIGPYEYFIDCNSNGIYDKDDVLSGFSNDFNQNLMPDECEDCNDNGIPDDLDLRANTSDDCDDNDVPDDCERDCNDNGINDVCDLMAETSEDVNYSGIPDECEDCNNNGITDNVDITINGFTDCDFDGLLDICESDCDDDGTPNDCENILTWNGGDAAAGTTGSGLVIEMYVPHPPINDVRITISTTEALGDTDEFLLARMEPDYWFGHPGGPPHYLFVENGPTCEIEKTETWVIPRAEFMKYRTSDTHAWAFIGLRGSVDRCEEFFWIDYTVEYDYVEDTDIEELAECDCVADCSPVGGDGQVNIDDLLAVILAFGSDDAICDIAPPGGDGTVDIDDLLLVVLSTGICP